MNRPSWKAEYDKFTMYRVTGEIRYGQTILSKRVWWKPWTWRREKIFVGGEWEKQDYIHAVPKVNFNIAPTSDFNGDFSDISIRQIDDEH